MNLTEEFCIQQIQLYERWLETTIQARKNARDAEAAWLNGIEIRRYEGKIQQYKDRLFALTFGLPIYDLDE